MTRWNRVMSSIRNEAGILGINRRNLDFVYKGYRPGLFRPLDDKVVAKDILDSAGIPTPYTIAILRDQRDLKRLEGSLDGAEEIVLKPANGWGGRGIILLKRDGTHWRRTDDTVMTASQLIAHASEILAGTYSLDSSPDSVLVEERIYQHAFFDEIYAHGLSDIRVVVEKGQPIQAMSRVPSDSSDGKANLHEGGVGLGIDLESGNCIGAVCLDREVATHPDTGIELTGLKIPYWDKVLEIATSSSKAFGLDYIGVDIVMDVKRGPLVLEVNARPGLAIQIANLSGQKVTVESPRPFMDRATATLAWMILIIFSLAPLTATKFWSDREDPVQVTVTGERTEDESQSPANSILAVGEGAYEEIPLAEDNELFALARRAVAEGRIDDARLFYNEAVADSVMAPFALNNLALMARREDRHADAEALLRRALNIYPEYARGQYNLGLVMLALEQPDSALTAFQTVLQIRPNHARSWRGIGDILFRRGELDGAEQAYDKAVQYRPDSHYDRFRMGLTLRRSKRTEEALAWLHSAVALRNDHEPSLYWYSRTLLEVEAFEPSAIEPPLNLSALLDEYFDSTDGSVRCYEVAARLAWQDGRWRDGRNYCRSLVDTEPDVLSHRRDLVSFDLQLGFWKEARRVLNALRRDVDDVPTSLLALCELGQTIDESAETGIETLLVNAHKDLRLPQDLRNYLKSIAAELPLDESLAIIMATASTLKSAREGDWTPSALPAWYALISAEETGNSSRIDELEQIIIENKQEFVPLLRSRISTAKDDGRCDTAAAARLLALDRSDPAARSCLATAALSAKDPEAARRHWRKARRSWRRSVPGRVLESTVLRAEHDDGSARKVLRSVVRDAPDHLEARDLLGDVNSSLGHTEESIDHYRKVLERDPSRASTTRKLAKVLMNERRNEEATVLWERLDRLGQAGPSDVFALGLTLQRDDRDAEAVPVYDKAITLRPTHIGTHYNRALALQRLGRLSEAISGFHDTLRLKPDHTASLKHLAELENKDSS
jgi:alpha-L-glutamate ligase-like protein